MMWGGKWSMPKEKYSSVQSLFQFSVLLLAQATSHTAVSDTQSQCHSTDKQTQQQETQEKHS